MSIVKKLPAVLIAAVGIFCCFAGTALADEIFVEKTLGPTEDLDIDPPDMRNTKICFKATDNLQPRLLLVNMADYRNPQMLDLPRELSGQKVSQESGHQCISMSLRSMPAFVRNLNMDDSSKSKSIHVYARQE
jgi:hypothetical protein